jgi:DNA-binding MarR family transcriptional regulator
MLRGGMGAMNSANASTSAVPADDSELDLFSFDDYDNVIGFVISQAADTLTRRLEAVISQTGITITPREFAVLNRLHQLGEMTQTLISESTYKDPASTSRVVESLRAKRMVNRKVSKIDRRVTHVSLTDKGRAVRAVIVPRFTVALREAAGSSSPQELMAALRVLKRIAGSAESASLSCNPASRVAPPD